MKTLKLLIAALAFPLLAVAQEVEINKNGVVTVNGQESFKIDGKQGVANTTFSVYNLDGDLLISADGRSETNTMTVTFSGSNAALDYPMTIGTKKVFARDIARMQVIKDGALNADGLKRFIAKYNGRADQRLVLTDQNTRNTIHINAGPMQVVRNRNANLFISRSVITQDNKQIGRISNKQDLSEGKIFDFFTITDMEGNHVATASKSMSAREVEIVTFDKKRYVVQAQTANLNQFALEEFIVRELIKRGQL